MIAPDDHWALWAVLLSAAAFGLWAERTRWGARVSGAVLSIAATFVLSNLGVIPASAPAYDAVWSFLVPLAIPLLLLTADLRRILREAGPTLVAFAAGAVGTVAGTAAALHLVPLGPESWKVAGIFCATYIGGSMNYVAAAEALRLHDADLLSAGVAADNLMMTVYFLVLFALPSLTWLRRRYPVHAPVAEAGNGERREASPISLHGMATALALSAVCCAASYGIAQALGIPTLAILILTGVVVALATALPGPLARLGGARELGTLMMQVFFAAIGASANIGVVIRVGPALLLFAAVILAVHLLVILTVGRALRLDLSEIVIASNANMGGPTTAAAMAVARRWDGLVIPAILCGTLGYAVATFVGVAVAHWLR